MLVRAVQALKVYTFWSGMRGIVLLRVDNVGSQSCAAGSFPSTKVGYVYSVLQSDSQSAW